MDAHVPEYQKIRAYLLNLIASSDGAKLQIPPENELCGIFGVTRPTVRNALKGLIEEGYLLARRGVGTFINPDRIDRDVLRTPQMGVLYREGGALRSNYMADVFRMIEMNGMNYEPLYLPDSEDTQRLVEMVRPSLDAVLWFEPPESRMAHFEALKAAGIPFLLVARDWEPPFDRIETPDGFKAGYFIAEAFHAKGHDNFLYVHNTRTEDGRLSAGSWLVFACKRLSELTGVRHEPKDHFAYLKDFPSFARKMLENPARFTAVYAVSKAVPQIVSALEREGLSIPRDVSLLSYMEPDPCLFGGVKADFIDFCGVMREAFYEWRVKRLVEGERGGVFRRQIEYRVAEGGTLLDINKNARRAYA